jgi:hypothetical protein
MVKRVFVVSTERFSGKTAVAAGLIMRLRRDGFEPGYGKPVSGSPRVVGTDLIDPDAAFVRRTFELDAGRDQVVPVRLTDSLVDQQFARLRREDEDSRDGLLERIRSAYETLGERYKTLVLEGAGDLAEGALLGLSAPAVAEALDLPTLVVTPYDGRLTGDRLLQAQRVLGERMIGGLINAVPERQMDPLRERVVPLLESRVVPVFGLIPHRRLLGGATVRELADQIDGELLVGVEHAESLVETLCIGAMGIDDVLAHFRRKRGKAVIVEGARTNIQFAALETSTRCLILTGNLKPKAAILNRAAEREIPVVLSRLSTIETVEAINNVFGRTRFHEPEKLDLVRQVMEEGFDFDRLYQALGLEA